MRRLARAASSLPPIVLLACATGCWPGIPIAVIAAAAGGGGGGGGGSYGSVLVQGHIVTDGSAFATSLAADHEPNDRLGMAVEVGADATAHVAGSAATTATLHALVDDGGRRSIVARELLADDGRTFAADVAAAGPPSQIARIDRELFVLDAAARGQAPVVRVTPLESAFVKRRFEFPRELSPAGFTALLDALLVLDAGNGTTRLLAADPADGTPLFMADLAWAGLVHLAGAEEIASGKPRLFTSAGGRVLEIAIEQTGDDRRFGAVSTAFTPEDLVGGIAALGYDGALVHVVDGGGTLRSYEPDGHAVATRPLLAAGTRAVSLVAHCDLGFDGYHVEVATGARTSVDVRVAGADGARLFVFALPRADLERPTAGAPAFAFDLAGGTHHAEIDNTAGTTPAEYDLVVGARAGAGRYALALGDGRVGPLPAQLPPARDDAARQLGDWLETNLFEQLPVARLVEIYRDPRLPDFDPSRIAVGTKDASAGAAALTVPTVGGFALGRDARQPGGYEVWSHRPDATWNGPHASTLHGTSPRASREREESRATLALLARLAGTPGMAWREPVYYARACNGIATVNPNDPQFQAQKWAFDEMHVRDAWDLTTGDASTVMAIVDTGIRTDNTDLIGNYTTGTGFDGFDFVSATFGPGSSGDGDGLDPDPFDEGSFASDSHHGSHVAGTIGTKGNNNIGLTGINWDCTLLPVRALGVDGQGTTTDIAQGMLYAARLSNVSGTLPAAKAAVINLSLGTVSPSNAIHNALKAAVAQGCIVCCAAGNDGNGASILFPAAFPEAIAIAACDIGDGFGNNIQIAAYSNTGPELDLTAPGGGGNFTDLNSDGFVDEIWSTIGGDSIAALAGTSMACSEASGVCGLVKSLNPSLTQSQVLALLSATAQDIETPGFDDLSGHGIIDANAAAADVLAVLRLGADEVDLGATGQWTLVQALNIGPSLSKLSVSSLQATAIKGGITSWLTTTVAADGKTIVLDSDRTGLANGDYQIRVDVTTNGGTGSFLVDLTQTASSTPTDVGTVKIQLLASDGTTVVATTTASPANGYAYAFPLVPPGKYFLQAGVDGDDDGVLHEGGELFGAYPRGGGTGKQLLELDHLTRFEIDFVVK
ncbi:MAG TPA: S8 family serine peptidase [Planctomycetota bacterium]|nr:S8 family serine peptidase [Planctomycetota bacterium]